MSLERVMVWKESFRICSLDEFELELFSCMHVSF